MAEKTSFQIWLVGKNDPLRVAIEKLSSCALKVISDRQSLDATRFTLMPALVVICQEWTAGLEGFVKACSGSSVWVDLQYQNQQSLGQFQSVCRTRKIDGHSLDFGAQNLTWITRLIESQASESGSMLDCIRSKEGSSPTIFSSRVSNQSELGSRIDFLAQKNPTIKPHQINMVVSSLGHIGFSLASELKSNAKPVLALYAGDLNDSIQHSWLVSIHIPFVKRHQFKAELLISSLKEGSLSDAAFAFQCLTRETAAFVATITENLVELSVIVNAQSGTGANLLDPLKSFRESFVVRKKQLTNKFVPQACVYSSFPEPIRKPAPSEVKLLEKAWQELNKVPTGGSDEGFAAFLSGIDGSDGHAEPRYSKLVKLIERSGTPEQQELMRDLVKRFFALVEETRSRKQRAAS